MILCCQKHIHQHPCIPNMIFSTCIVTTFCRKLQSQFSLNSATQRLTMVQDWNLYTIVEVLIFPWDKVFTSQHHELITTVKEWLNLVNIGYVFNNMKTNNMQQCQNSNVHTYLGICQHIEIPIWYFTSVAQFYYKLNWISANEKSNISNNNSKCLLMAWSSITHC